MGEKNIYIEGKTGLAKLIAFILSTYLPELKLNI